MMTKDNESNLLETKFKSLKKQMDELENKYFELTGTHSEKNLELEALLTEYEKNKMIKL